MHRQQFSIIAALAIGWATTTFAGDFDNQGTSGWKAANEEASGTTISGRLYRNSSDQTGTVAPFVVLDRFGVVRGYVAAGSDVGLEQYVGKQVSLQGTAKALPGGDMTCLTVDRILSGNGSKGPQGRVATQSHVRPVAQTDDRDMDVAPQPAPLRRVTDDSQFRPAQPQRTTQPRRTVAYDDNTVSPAPAPRSGRVARSQAVSYTEQVPTPAAMPAPAGISPMPAPDNVPMSTGPESNDSELVGPYPTRSEPLVEGPSHFRHGTPVMDDDCECNTCGPCVGGCDPCCNDGCDGMPAHRPLFCIGPTGLWVQADFLLWSERGMNVPALVTSGPGPAASVLNGAGNPGILGLPGTSVLFGNDEINDRTRAGGRLRAGVWLDACQTVGMEGEYVGVSDQNTNFYLWSDGNPIIARPYFNVGPSINAPTTPFNNQDAELVAVSGGLAGSVAVDAKTSFSGEAARFVFALCKCEGCWNDCCNSYHDSYHSYLMIGYRHLDLNDTLGIQEYLTDAAFDRFAVHDEFDTQNSFNGGELAMKFEVRRNRWWLDVTPRIALGDSHQVANIGGATQITDGTTNVRTSYTGGLLAQQTNIGSYSRDVFAAVPEIDLNVGYQITPHARLDVGYSFLYWSNVLRAGDQIDTSVNAALVPNSGLNVVGDPTRPHFAYQATSFYAQGVNFGLTLTW